MSSRKISNNQVATVFKLAFLLLLCGKIKEIKSKELEIKLAVSMNNLYYIYINGNSSEENYPVALGSAIELSLLPAEECEKSDSFYEGIGEIIQENYTYTRKGIDYEGNLTLGTYKIKEDETEKDYEFEYLYFSNVSLVESFDDYGFFSISFANKHIGNYFPYISLMLIQNSDETIYLGNELHTKIIKDVNKLNNYTVHFDDEANPTSWYLEAEKLEIKSGDGKGTHEYTISAPYKLTFDTMSWKFLIPHDFFYENIEDILYEDLGCEYLSSGSFGCFCSTDFKKKFPTFYFYVNGSRIQVIPTDYMSYDGNSDCTISLGINYDNEYFIGGLNVLNNYFTTFNYPEKKLMIYEYKDPMEQARKTTPAVFCVVFICAAVLFIMLTCTYKKNISHNNQVEIEEDNVHGFQN